MIALIVIAVGATIYFLFFRSKVAPEALTSTSGSSDGSPVIGQELVTELNRLKSLRSINKNFFTDPAFVSLKDVTQPVEPQPLGRANPFSPVGADTPNF